MSIFCCCNVYAGNVSVLEQELSRRCNELSDNKADKEFILSVINAVGCIFSVFIYVYLDVGDLTYYIIIYVVTCTYVSLHSFILV